MNERNKPVGELVEEEAIRAAVVAQETSLSLSERYSQETGLRGFVQMIPFIGSPLDLMFSAPGAAAREERIWDFLRTLKQDLESTDQSKIDQEFLTTPEFEGVVAQTFRAVVVTSSEEKLQMLRQAFIGSVTVQSSHDPLRDSLLAMVGTLSPEHIRVMRFIDTTIREKRRADELTLTMTTDRDSDLGRNHLVDRQELEWSFTAWGEHKWEPILGDLIARGIVEPLAPVGTFRPDTAGRFRVTELGDELLSLLAKGRTSP